MCWKILIIQGMGGLGGGVCYAYNTYLLLSFSVFLFAQDAVIYATATAIAIQGKAAKTKS